MNNYLLEETIKPCTAEELHAQKDCQYVAILTTPEWEKETMKIMMMATLNTFS